ncbi:hypothetical protein B0H17DRAFT_1145939 [Mycena rosella]|uniref:Uncharacterized protein n=1 Tax=Mycena rosella TaxID=1033263 RepID=A0AAD7CPV6_MYCRO|nr:hypothetical protein B0H17DRAFT_1145939 [Mycena rosella]
MDTRLADTWARMLEQVHRLTSSAACGIVEVYPNACVPFKAYEGTGAAGGVQGEAPHERRGTGQYASQVVGTVMYGTDPLQLMAKVVLGRGQAAYYSLQGRNTRFNPVRELFLGYSQ